MDTSNILISDYDTKFQDTREYIADTCNYLNEEYYNKFTRRMIIQTNHKTYTKTVIKEDYTNGWVAIDNDIENGFVVNIKPSHNTSVVLISMTCHIGMDYEYDSRWWGIQLYRKIGNDEWIALENANGSDYGVIDCSPCWISHNMGADNSLYSHSIINVSGSYEDNPGTTSNVYYTAYWKSKLNNTYGKLYLNRPAYTDDINNVSNYPITSSSWTASEIWNTGTPYLPKTSAITITDNNVGIGLAPSVNSIYKLDVNGNINITTSVDDNYKLTINGRDIITETSNFIIATSNLLSNNIRTTNDTLLSSDVWNKSGNNINNKNIGNVGIGTDNPLKKLHILQTHNSGGTIDTTNIDLVEADVIISSMSLPSNRKDAGIMFFASGASGSTNISVPSSFIKSGWTTAGSTAWNKSYIDFNTHGTNTTSWTTDMRIQGGKVGIGTTNPTELLTLNNGNLLLTGTWNSSSKYNIQCLNTDKRIEFDYTNGTGIFDNNKITLNAGNQQIMSILNTGNVGIGITNPTNKVHIIKNSTSTNADNGNIGLYVYNPTNAANNHSIICNRIGGTSAGRVLFVLDVLNSHGWSMYTSGNNRGFAISSNWEGQPGNEKLFITFEGNVGIGKTEPVAGYKLDVNGSTLVNGNLGLNATNAGIIWSGTNSLLGRVGVAGTYSTNSIIDDIVLRSSGRLLLQSGTGTPSIVVTSTNNVGIGTTNPFVGNKLQVEGNTYMNGNAVINGNLEVNSNLIIHGTTTTLNTDVYSTENLDITNSGNKPSFSIKQLSQTNNIINVSNYAGEIFNIDSSGNINFVESINNINKVQFSKIANIDANNTNVSNYVRISSDILFDDYVYRDAQLNTTLSSAITTSARNVSNYVDINKLTAGNNISIGADKKISVNLISYTGDATINGNLTVCSNLTVDGTTTYLNTDVYTTEKLNVTNSGLGPALTINQTSQTNNIINISNYNSEVFNIANNGDIKILGKINNITTQQFAKIANIDNNDNNSSNYTRTASNILFDDYVYRDSQLNTTLSSSNVPP